MTDTAIFLLAPLAMCLVIASIHVYLGMHVLAREVIFVNLAFAQVAALGASVAYTAEGGHEHGHLAHLGAGLFTFGAAAIFAFTRRVRKHVSQEAIVGIVYAVAGAMTVLLLSRAPHGAEHIKELLVGALLLTSWEQVGGTAAAYVVLGTAQLALARRFIMMSWEPDEAERTMSHIDWWDFLFYLLFGAAITISVQVAGILLVFSYLIVPAVVTALFTQRLVARLVLGWLVATVASLLGLGASWAWDLPTGAAVVTAFGLVLVAAGCVRFVFRPR